MGRPTIAVTIGDPAGIGPETALRAVTAEAVQDACRPVIVGSVAALEQCAQWCGFDPVPIQSASSPMALPDGPLVVLDVPVPGIDTIRPGRVQALGGNAAVAYLRRACRLALDGFVQAIATGPINKESLAAAGMPGVGHTELLASYFEVEDPLTLFITERMRIFFLTRHLSLRDALKHITEQNVLQMLRRVSAALHELGLERPRVAVAALNPHASDGGLFGEEEHRELEPAVAAAQAEGLEVVGPVPADSVFHQALEGRWDAVLSLYHDQGHIAAKTRDFHRTVTATLGLPVLRTSVDHGTAFDIAWTGQASSVSMEAAILAAAELLQTSGK